MITPYGDLIRANAAIYGVKPETIACIILQESSGNPWAFETEKNQLMSKFLWKTAGALIGFVPKVTPWLFTEKVLRSSSFGLMQILGETARERGFDRQYLTELFVPEVNVQWGCLIFSKMLQSVNGDIRAGLLRWNGGGDRQYPDKVFARESTPEFGLILK